MTKTINMLDFRRRAGEVLDEVFYRKDRVVVRRGRKNMAVLIPLEDYRTYITEADTELYSDKELAEMLRRDALSADLRGWVRRRRSRPRRGTTEGSRALPPEDSPLRHGSAPSGRPVPRVVLGRRA